MSRRAAGALILALLALMGAPLAGQETADRARGIVGEPRGVPLEGEALNEATERVAALMRCPVCQGLSVADSPTASAIAMREEARGLLAAGFDQEQVLSYFERSYGEFIRLAPKPQGFNVVVWVLPLVALLAGVALVWWYLRSRRPVRVETEVALDPYLERVRREVGE